MNKEFVNYEQALALKELGFDETCLKWYMHSNNLSDDVIFLQYKKDDEFCYAPLKQQVFRWFREKHDLFGCIDLQACSPSHWFIRIDKIEINDYLYHSEDENVKYNTYEEAEDACIDKLIEKLIN